MTNLIGQSLGRYHILEQLGEGGMAVVYKAYDTRLETDVAVKIIRTENLAPSIVERALKRFEREAKALAKLTHANIVKVIDYGEYEGKPYLVMPFLPGGTLKQRLQGKPMPWQDAMYLLLPIARALSYAHKQGMVHRDIKPSNILITEAGDPLLTDFGIAKIIDEESTVDLTGTSATVGTPEYMAPEQVTSKSVDARADIYALGVVLYEMVTGRKPFQADTPMAVLFKHASEPLPRPKQFVHDLPEAVEMVLIKALAKKPENRYQSMDEFAGAMEQLGQRLKVTSATMQPNLPITPETPPASVPPSERPSSTQSGFSLKGWMWGVLGACAVLGLICLIGSIVLIIKLVPGGIANPVAALTHSPSVVAVVNPPTVLSLPTEIQTLILTSIPTRNTILTQTPMPTSTLVPCNWAQFVTDVTIPDNWETGPSSHFTKTWRLKNIGSCTWTSEYSLVFATGDRMGAPDLQQLTTGTVAPGGTTDVSMDLISPNVAGTYQGYYFLRASDGTLFGMGPSANDAFWVKIKVVNPALSAPAIAPTTQSVNASVTLTPGAVDSATATCPAGTVVTGGGFSVGLDVWVYTQLKQGNGWIAYAKNNAGANRSLTTYAICLTYPSAATTQILASKSVDGGGAFATETSVCPASSVVTGGGYTGKQDGSLWTYFSGVSGNGWQVSAKNSGGFSTTFNLYAICLSGTTLTTTTVLGNADIAPSSDGWAEVACPIGKVIVSGGFELSDDLMIFASLMSKGYWRVSAHNTGGQTRSLVSSAVCLG